ncbi:MAG: hypothetical protein K9H61_05485 [Bacteroidia bacterium]|nr:hypothetical protein [Bacteroidia bacterium]MCF8425392.1 hypothetical protein [Bacteroidia bacterium]MCF8446433.1 hypothetical protein [Bacteroidia bacterium]
MLNLPQTPINLRTILILVLGVLLTFSSCKARYGYLEKYKVDVVKSKGNSPAKRTSVPIKKIESKEERSNEISVFSSLNSLPQINKNSKQRVILADKSKKDKLEFPQKGQSIYKEKIPKTKTDLTSRVYGYLFFVSLIVTTLVILSTPGYLLFFIVVFIFFFLLIKFIQSLIRSRGKEKLKPDNVDPNKRRKRLRTILWLLLFSIFVPFIFTESLLLLTFSIIFLYFTFLLVIIFWAIIHERKIGRKLFYYLATLYTLFIIFILGFLFSFFFL